jgi:hypothetical protein
MSKDARVDPQPEHLFDQTNGVAGVASERDDESNIDRAAQKARGAALGATGAAGWGR